MRGSRQITVAVALTLAIAGSVTAQRGPMWGGRGEARGFRGVGLGNWVLQENGIDSVAAWFDLTDEQRGEFEQLANEFRSENSEVLQRWQQMRDEIQGLYTEDQMPTRAAIQRIGEKYDHPAQELAPALDQLRAEAAAVLTPEQRRGYARGAFGAGRMGIRGGQMGMGPGIGRRAPLRQRPLGGRAYQRLPRWRPPDNQQ